MPDATATDPLQRALEDLRGDLRAAGARRAAAIEEREQADREIADLAIRAKGTLPVDEIRELVGLKTRKSVYALIDWRTASKPRH